MTLRYPKLQMSSNVYCLLTESSTDLGGAMFQKAKFRTARLHKFVDFPDLWFALRIPAPILLLQLQNEHPKTPQKLDVFH